MPMFTIVNSASNNEFVSKTHTDAMLGNDVRSVPLIHKVIVSGNNVWIRPVLFNCSTAVMKIVAFELMLFARTI